MNLPTLQLRWPFVTKAPIPWWIKVRTESPNCTYYFGPFDSEHEARLSQGGYIDDLQQENAQGITTEIKRIRPKTLTIAADD